MPEPTIHLVLVRPSSETDAWALYSPQIKGFAAFRDSAEELDAEMADILDFADGIQYPNGSFARHTEIVMHVDDVDVLVRISSDEHVDHRREVAERLVRAFNQPEQRPRLLAYPRRKTDEVLFICAVPGDRVTTIAEQLQPSGDAAVALLAVADEHMWALLVTNSDELVEGTEPLHELDINPDLTIGEVMRADSSSATERRILFT